MNRFKERVIFSHEEPQTNLYKWKPRVRGMQRVQKSLFCLLNMHNPYTMVAFAPAPYGKRNVLRQTLAAVKDLKSKCTTISHMT